MMYVLGVVYLGRQALLFDFDQPIVIMSAQLPLPITGDGKVEHTSASS